MRHLSVIIPILISLLMASCQCTQDPELSAFKSDGCSCFPEGPPGDPDLWEEDCRNHDYAYWKGGTREERKQADLIFRNDLRDKDKPVTAQLAYAGVRVFGSPWLPFPWRWDFGWNDYCRGYEKVSEGDIPAVYQ